MQCPRCGTQNQPEQETCTLCGFLFASRPQVTTDTNPEITLTTITEPELVQPYSSGDNHNIVPYQSPLEADLTTTKQSSRVPVVVAVVIALLAVIGTVVAVLLSAANSDGQGIFSLAEAPTPTGTPFSIEPAALLDLSSKAMKDVHTLHYQSEVGFYGLQSSSPVVTSTDVLSMTLNGDVMLPGRYTMNTDAVQLGQFIVISDTTWMRNNGNPNWSQRSTTDVGLGPVNPLAVAAYLQYYKQGTPQYIGSETRHDSVLHHIRFDVDTQTMGMDSPQRSVQDLMFHSRITADAWIRDKDNLLDSMALAVDTGDGKGVILRTALSSYNTQVDIKPPNGTTP